MNLRQPPPTRGIRPFDRLAVHRELSPEGRQDCLEVSFEMQPGVSWRSGVAERIVFEQIRVKLRLLMPSFVRHQQLVDVTVFILRYFRVESAFTGKPRVG